MAKTNGVCYNKLEGGLKQRYKQVLVPSAVNGLDHDIKVWVQRDFMAAFTLMHAVYNEKLIPDKGKTKRRKSDKSKSKVLNDVDVATCRADWAAFMKDFALIWSKRLCVQASTTSRIMIGVGACELGCK